MLVRPPGRQTNQALLVMLVLAFATGVATVAIGSPDGAWVARRLAIKDARGRRVVASSPAGTAGPRIGLRRIGRAIRVANDPQPP